MKKLLLLILMFSQPHSNQLDQGLDWWLCCSWGRGLLDIQPIGRISSIHSVRDISSILLSLMMFDSINGRCAYGDWNFWSKSGWIWDEKGYLILIIALHPFYLNPYDDIAQGPGKQLPNPFMSRVLSTRLPKEPMSKEQAFMNSGVTMLMVNHCLRDPNCPPHQSYPRLCFQAHSNAWVQESSFPWHFYAQGGLSSLLCCPLFQV